MDGHGAWNGGEGRLRFPICIWFSGYCSCCVVYQSSHEKQCRYAPAPSASGLTRQTRSSRRTPHPTPDPRPGPRTHTNTHTHVQRSRATAQTYGRISPKRRKRPRLNPLSSPHIDLRGPLSRRSSTRLPRPQRAATAARSLASPSSRFSRHKPTPKKFK